MRKRGGLSGIESGLREGDQGAEKAGNRWLAWWTEEGVG